MRLNPFRALRPPRELAAKVASVPYDVVNRDEAAELARGNAVSFLHVCRPDIDLPASVDAHDDRIYAQGRANLDRFQAEGTLVRDEQPGVYINRLVMGGRAQPDDLRPQPDLSVVAIAGDVSDGGADRHESRV